jgi:hypothetical protein
LKWIVNREGQEFVAQSIDELRRWHLDGRLSDADYVYHPVMNQWVYVADLRELRSVPLPGPIAPLPVVIVNKKRPTRLLGCMVFISFGVVIALAVKFDDARSARRRDEVQVAEQSQLTERREAALTAVKALGPGANAADLVKHCEVLAAYPLEPSVATLCGDAELSEAERSLGTGDLERATQLRDRAATRGATDEALSLAITEMQGQATRTRRFEAAEEVTERASNSILSPFEIKGSVAGPQCDLLLVTIGPTMGPPAIESLHEGRVAYGQAFPKGVRALAIDGGFRGTIYRDGVGNLWWFGSNVDKNDAEQARACRR